MLIIFAVGTVLYTGFLLLSWLGLLRSGSLSQKTFPDISVIIAARNEEQNLPRLLRSLSQLDYPGYEIIIVNDHSTDGSAALLDSWNGKHRIRILHLKGETPGLTGKKAAIDYGIKNSTYDLLAFTDADCVVPKDWLKQTGSGLGDSIDYVLGFSLLQRHAGGSLFRPRNFERSVYYALAAAGLYWRMPITSMACNIAYRKSVFLASGGFGDLGFLRSGDDDLLLMKMMPRIRKAIFDPSLVMRVISYDGMDSGQHHQTNIRRASKFRYYPLYLKVLAAFVFLYYALFYYILISSIFHPGSSLSWLFTGIKTGVELLLVSTLFTMVKEPRLILLYPVQILLFPAQFIFYAIRGSLGKYSWK